MKKFIIIFILFLSSFSYAFEYEKGIGIDSQFSYNKLNQTLFLEGEIHYAIPLIKINFLPYISGKNWLSDINSDNIMYSDSSGNALSGGLTINWENIFLTINGFYVNAKEVNENIWKLSNYWMSKKGFNFIFKYQFNSYLNEGIGFSASLGNNLEKDICFTELEINYRYITPIYFGVNIYGKQKTWFSIKDKNYIKGQPFCDIYTVGMEFCISGVSIFYEHFCAHDVYSDKKLWHNQSYRLSSDIGANGDVFGIKFKFN